MSLASTSVLLVKQTPRNSWHQQMCLQWEFQLLLASPGGSSRSAGGSDPGSFQITASVLKFRTCKPLCELFKSVSYSPMLCYAKSLQLCPTLCDPMDGSPPGSPVPGILQARTLEWVAISFSSAWKWKNESEVAQSCPTLSDAMDCSLTGSSVHGIF